MKTYNSYRGRFTLVELLVVISILGILVLICSGITGTGLGPTDPDTARRVLQENGYTQIEITGYRPFMGGKNDFYSTGFRARSPNGTCVTGAVTSGWMKGATIRFD